MGGADHELHPLGIRDDLGLHLTIIVAAHHGNGLTLHHEEGQGHLVGPEIETSPQE